MGFVYYVGFLVLALAGCCAAIWLAWRFPFLGALAKLLALISWGLFSAVLPLWAIFERHLPRHDYAAAVLTLGFAVFLTYFWVMIGLPPLMGMFKGESDWRLWRPVDE